MSINISLEEYELFKSFKEQIEEKKQEYFDLEIEKEALEKRIKELALFHERKKKKALVQLTIIEQEVIKARASLQELKKQSKKDARSLVKLEEKVCAIKNDMMKGCNSKKLETFLIKTGSGYVSKTVFVRLNANIVNLYIK